MSISLASLLLLAGCGSGNSENGAPADTVPSDIASSESPIQDGVEGDLSNDGDLPAASDLSEDEELQTACPNLVPDIPLDETKANGTEGDDVILDGEELPPDMKDPADMTPEEAQRYYDAMVENENQMNRADTDD